jgi:hypothetical protein
MCAKCKLQLDQHLADNQVQNNAPASNSIDQQCHHLNQMTKPSKINAKDAFPFQHFNSKEFINLQNALRGKNNLISVPDTQAVKTNQNLIKSSDKEIFLIKEKLREPLLPIANKFLGRQNLNFNQLTPPE